MARGGKRQGAGRKPGMLTKARKAVLDRANMAMTADETPLEVMLAVMRSATNAEDKLKAAIAAAPYVHPRLAAVQHSGDADNPVAMAIMSGVPRADADDDDQRTPAQTH